MPGFSPIAYGQSRNFLNCLGISRNPYAFPEMPDFCKSLRHIQFPTDHKVNVLGIEIAVWQSWCNDDFLFLFVNWVKIENSFDEMAKNRSLFKSFSLTLYLTTLFFLKLALWLRQQTVEAEQIPTVIKTNETFLMRGKEPAKKYIPCVSGIWTSLTWFCGLI